MSSFRRNTNKTADAPKTSITVKPWFNCGLGLVSSGNRQYDEFIGGGFPLGTLNLIGCDTISNFGATLINYTVAESISATHKTFIGTYRKSTIDNIMNTLPHNSYVKSSDGRKESIVDNKEKVNLNPDGLQIASSYKKYFQENTSDNTSSLSSSSSSYSTSSNTNTNTTSNPIELELKYCYSYDLSRRLQESVLERNRPTLYYHTHTHTHTHHDHDHNVSIEEYLQSLYHAIQTFISPPPPPTTTTTTTTTTTLQSNDDTTTDTTTITNITTASSSSNSNSNTNTNQVGRIILPDLSELLMTYNDSKETIQAICNFLIRVKQIIRTRQYLALFSVKLDMISSSLWQQISTISDAVFRIESFVGKSNSIPSEFREFSGFLFIHKLSNLGMLVPFRPSNDKFGLKRDRRKLHIEPLHLPPEDSRATASQSEKDANKISKVTQEYLQEKKASMASSTSSGGNTNDNAITNSYGSSSSSSGSSGVVSTGRISLQYDQNTAVSNSPSQTLSPSHPSSSSVGTTMATTMATNITTNSTSLGSLESATMTTNAMSPHQERLAKLAATAMSPHQERIAKLAAKFAVNVPQGSSINIASYKPRNSTGSNSGNISMSSTTITTTDKISTKNKNNQSMLCQPNNPLTNKDGQIDF